MSWPARSETKVTKGAAVRTVEIVNKRGLHARASAKFVKTASGYDAEVRVSKDGQTVDVKKKLPMNLLDALRALEASDVLKDALGELVPSYLKLKYEEWNSFAGHLTDWERQTTLDC